MRQAGLAANCVNLPHCAWYNEPHIATVASIGRTVISRHFSNTSALVCRADVCEPANHPSACLEWLAASFITFPVGDLHQLCVPTVCINRTRQHASRWHAQACRSAKERPGMGQCTSRFPLPQPRCTQGSGPARRICARLVRGRANAAHLSNWEPSGGRRRQLVATGTAHVLGGLMLRRKAVNRTSALRALPI